MGRPVGLRRAQRLVPRDQDDVSREVHHRGHDVGHHEGALAADPLEESGRDEIEGDARVGGHEHEQHHACGVVFGAVHGPQGGRA